jgi:hypothetical protein
MLVHLAQKQALEVLHLNIRLVEAYAQIDSKIEENAVKQISHSQNSRLVATKEKINPYAVDDMRNILRSRQETFQDLTNKNAVLVAENSKPVQYACIFRSCRYNTET